MDNELIDHCLVCRLIEDKIGIPKKLAKEYLTWANSQSFCNSGQHVCDRLAEYFQKRLRD